jgi:cytochrome c oxidase subunit 3
MFFAAFFGALFYARVLSVPWLGGSGADLLTQPTLWPDFKAVWPLINSPGTTMQSGIEIATPTGLVDAWHIPALNTLILLTSGATITWAHWALKVDNRKQLVLAMSITVLLGMIFLGFQMQEYGDAYSDLNLNLTSGIYGSTFYLLTGFHGFHVTLGTIMLIVILMRCVRGHFSKDNHFAFEAVAWYWHFVDVVWLGLFIFVYWI